jgi:hypothetical protein
MSNQPAAVSLFYSYSHEDEGLRDQLEKHLTLLENQGIIQGWHDRRLGAGTEWEGAIDTYLERARIILLLVSADFLASGYCQNVEVARAMERHESGTALVIPVILRACDWQTAFFGKLQALPRDGKPVASWASRDEAFTDVAKGIREAVKRLGSRAQSNPSPGLHAPLSASPPAASSGTDDRAVLLATDSGPSSDDSADKEDEARKGSCERLGRLLRRLKPESLRKLVRELLEDDDPANEVDAGRLAGHLTTRPQPTTDKLASLAEFHDSRCQSRASWEEADLLAEIIEEVTPLAINDALARQIRNEIYHRDSAFCLVPDHYSTTLEALMARVDRSSTKYRTPDAEPDDYEGRPLVRRAGKSKLPIEAPSTAESVAKSVLVDLCEGRGVRGKDESRTLKDLVSRFLGVLRRERQGENKKRTLYCFHVLPDDPREHQVHVDALLLIRKELDTLKPSDPAQQKQYPRFVFLLLAKKSDLEELRSIVVTVLLTRFKHERARTGHAASGS